MEPAAREAFLKKEAWTEYKREIASAIGAFDKLKTELQAKQIAFQKLLKKNTWLPQSRLNKCLKAVKHLEVIRSIFSNLDASWHVNM